LLKTIKNAAYLIFIQGLGYLSPLIVGYLIINRSGIEAFGEYSVYFSLALYCQVLFDMGHQFTATRRIASDPENISHISAVYWNAYAVKAVMLLLGVLLIFVVAVTVSLDTSQLLAALGYGVAAAGLPIWFFHGTDRFRQVALLIFASRVTSLVVILLFYTSGDSTAKVLWHQSWPNLLLAVGVALVLRRSGSLNALSKVSINIREEFRGTLHVMSSSLGGSAMANMPLLVLGILKSDYIVGAYAGADRLIKVLSSAMMPISQAAFPVNSARFADSTAAGLRSVIQLGSLLLVAFVIMVAGVWLLGDLYFQHFQLPDESRDVLLLLLGWLFWGVMNNIIGIQGLLAAGYGKIYNISVWGAVVITLALLVLLVPKLGAIGTALAVLLGEFSMFLLMSCYALWLKVKRHGRGET
jgi:PST family polysaccharide transporter